MGWPSSRYVIDPDDPRAPPQEVWDAMSDAERADVLANLPSEFPISESAPPEGEPHYDALVETREVLRTHFGRTGRRIYVANNLPVYYPGERMFSPDVIAVTDVDTHVREHWTVSAEGKGLDLALEVLWSGRRTKDLRDNVERYARLGIEEYFVFDRRRLRISGYRLASPGARTYQPIVPQAGRYGSNVLGLELAMSGDRLRFWYGIGLLSNAKEFIEHLERMLDQLDGRREAAERRAEEEARRADDAEGRLAAALAELERLKRSR